KTIGTSYYRPILAISFILDAQEGGTQPWIYHRTNVVLHVLGSLMVFYFLIMLGYNRIVSFSMGILFAFHPILTPAACWISGRNDSLITVFILIFFITLAAFYRTAKWYKWLFLLFNLIAYTLSLYTKEIAAMLPFVAFIYILWYRKEKPFIFKNILITLFWFFIGLVWWSMRSKALEGIKNPDTIGFDALIKNFPTVPAMIGKIILPVKMIALSSFEWFSIASGIVFIIAIGLYIYFSKTIDKPKALFGVAWFVTFLFPTLMVRIVYVDDFFDYAEHRAYLAMVGIVIILIEIFKAFKIDFKKPIPIIAIALVFITLTVRSNVYVPKFEDRKKFWTQMVDMYPYKSRGYLDLGKAYFSEQKFKEAEKLYIKGVERNPNNFNLYIDLAAIASNEKNWVKADKFARKAVQLDPTNVLGNYHLANSLVQRNMNQEALQYFETANNNNVKFPHIPFELGLVYYKLKEYDKAVQVFNRTLSMNPQFAEAYSYLGAIFALRKQFENAEVCLNNAISIKPDLLDPHYNLINLYLFQKKFTEAGRAAAAFRKINPNLPPQLKDALDKAGVKY
ncbi:MAG: Tetratricopeptide repeat protein, partial [Bacteroidota bacterium]|nr:Tetratricopeptide repeat protein [Bacteroidota bacterium]